MIKFVCYNLDGNIINWGSCPDDALQYQDPLGNQILVGEGTALTHYVSNGELVSYTPEQSALKDQRPKFPCKWDNTLMQWADLRTVEQQKEARWNKIKQARDDAEFAGFSWDGSTFDSDPMSQQRITGAVTLAQLNPAFSIGWTLASNDVRTLSAADMLAVGQALGVHVATIFAQGQALRTQLMAATTVEAIEAIDWP